MKLVRYGSYGLERPGVLDASARVRDLSGHLTDLCGDALLPSSIERIRGLDLETLPLVAGTPRLGACVSGSGKFVCIGLNYTDHAVEANMTIPPEPIVFMKATSAISGPHDDIEMPLGGSKLDWEAELAIVIGAQAKYVSEERAFQLEHQGQWTKGKSHDTFGPVGPWLVTVDEVADPQRLAICLDVNGRRFQDGSTATMVYTVRYLVVYLSRFMTLHPGDIIATGTPAGVGLGQKPPVYLNVGDRISLGIEGLGTQQQTVIAPREQCRTTERVG